MSDASLISPSSPYSADEKKLSRLPLLLDGASNDSGDSEYAAKDPSEANLERAYLRDAAKLPRYKDI